MRSIVLIAALSVACVSPALAKDKKPVDPNKRVCRQDGVTGSMMLGKPVCHSVAEWAQIDAGNAAAAQAVRNAGRMGAATIGTTR